MEKYLNDSITVRCAVYIIPKIYRNFILTDTIAPYVLTGHGSFLMFLFKSNAYDAENCEW